jgi:hypothetical protein
LSLVNGPLSVVDGPLAAAGDTLESRAMATNATNEPTLDVDVGPDGPTYMNGPTQNSTNEPTVAGEIPTNEPTDGCENVTNEPTAACEIVTNVTTVAVDVGPDGPTYARAQNATNEPTDDRENATNEATVGIDVGPDGPTYVHAQNVTNEPTAECDIGANEATVAAAVGLESPTYIKAAEHNSTTEPALAALGDGSPSVEMTAGINDGEHGDFLEGVSRQASGEWVRMGLARMAARRADTLRELNEEGRNEANATNTAYLSRSNRYKDGNPADRPDKPADGTEPRMTRTNPGRTIGDSAELVNAASGLTTRAGPDCG